jgi:divalent metal cation (Fe/Co/Zn/Cd) transporter
MAATTTPAPTPDAAERLRLQRLAIRLEYGTIAWNLGEAVLTIALGIAAGSLALIAFGTDSIIEVFASSVVVWHERKEGPADAARSSRALRLVAAAFVALAVVLGTVAVRDLATGRRAEESMAGIVYLTMTACVMFGLAVWKRRVATRLGSAPLRSEAALTFLDGILSVLTLTGLALNAAFGLWWADPAAALFVALAAANEGRATLREGRRIAAEAAEAA